MKDDCISRRAVLDVITYMKNANPSYWHTCDVIDREDIICEIVDLPSINPRKTGHCKDCRYFEYDSFAKVDGIPLIVAHEICNKWGEGCKTREDGFCFLFEPKADMEDKE